MTIASADHSGYGMRLDDLAATSVMLPLAGLARLSTRTRTQEATPGLGLMGQVHASGQVLLETDRQGFKALTATIPPRELMAAVEAHLDRPLALEGSADNGSLLRGQEAGMLARRIQFVVDEQRQIHPCWRTPSCGQAWTTSSSRP